MNKSALKYLAKAKIAPVERLIRQDAFATDRTQQRKRPENIKVKPTGR